MYVHRSIGFAILLTVGGIACGSDDPKTGTTIAMSGFVDEISATLAALSDRIETHHTNVGAALTLTAIHHAEAVYKVDITVMYNELHSASHELLTCVEVLPALDLDPLDAAINAMQTEVDGHASNTLSAVDVVAAQTEETRYQDAMTAVVMALESERDTLVAQAAGIRCPYAYVGKVPHDHSSH